MSFRRLPTPVLVGLGAFVCYIAIAAWRLIAVGAPADSLVAERGDPQTYVVVTAIALAILAVGVVLMALRVPWCRVVAATGAALAVVVSFTALGVWTFLGWALLATGILLTFGHTGNVVFGEPAKKA